MLWVLWLAVCVPVCLAINDGNRTTTVITAANAEAQRVLLVEGIWNSTLPTEVAVPGASLAFGNFNYTEMTHATVTMNSAAFFEGNQSSVDSPLFPAVYNKLVVCHAGHGVKWDSDCGDFITFALRYGGYDVAVAEMPPGSHAGVPLRDFLDPILYTINYARSLKTYDEIIMTGLSGGGWTAVVLCAAAPFIDRCAPVAGTWPFYLRYADGGAGSIGDEEQQLPGIPQNYLDLYALSMAFGRTHIAIYNLNDPCCFSGLSSKLYIEEMLRVAPELNGTFGMEIMPHNAHEMFSSTWHLILGAAARDFYWLLDDPGPAVGNITEANGILTGVSPALANYASSAAGLIDDGGTAVSTDDVDDEFELPVDVYESYTLGFEYGVQLTMQHTTPTGDYGLLFGLFGGSVPFPGPNLFANVINVGGTAGAANKFLCRDSNAVGVLTQKTGLNDGVARTYTCNRRVVGHNPQFYVYEVWVDDNVTGVSKLDNRQELSSLVVASSYSFGYILSRLTGVDQGILGTFDNITYRVGASFDANTLGGFTADDGFVLLLDEDLGSTEVNDTSGFNHTGTVSGDLELNVTSISGELGTAAYFPASGASITIPHALLLLPGSREYSFEAFIQTSNSTPAAIFTMGTVNVAINSIDPGALLLAETALSDLARVSSNDTSLADGTSHHVIAQRRMTRPYPVEQWMLEIYVDGLLSNSLELEYVQHHDSEGDAYVGSTDGTQQFFHGTMDNVKWNVGSAYTEEQALAASQLSVAPNVTEVLNTTNATDPVNATNATEVLNTTNTTESVNATNATDVLNTTNTTELANSTNTTEPVNATNATVVLNSTNTTELANSTNATGILNSTNATGIANATNATGTLNSTNATDIANSTNATGILNSTNATDTTNATDVVNTTNATETIEDVSIPVSRVAGCAADDPIDSKWQSGVPLIMAAMGCGALLLYHAVVLALLLQERWDILIETMSMGSIAFGVFSVCVAVSAMYLEGYDDMDGPGHISAEYLVATGCIMVTLSAVWVSTAIKYDTVGISMEESGYGVGVLLGIAGWLLLSIPLILDRDKTMTAVAVLSCMGTAFVMVPQAVATRHAVLSVAYLLTTMFGIAAFFAVLINVPCPT